MVGEVLPCPIQNRSLYHNQQKYVDLGLNIALYRKKAGLTQEQLADVTGIHQTNISKLESGTANPSLRTLKRLAAGMGMKLKLEFVPAQPDSSVR